MAPIVLIADDQEHRGAVLGQLFAERGFWVLRAATGIECIEVLQAIQTHVLLVSLEIRWGGGEGVLACLHDGLRLPRKPRILLMGDAPAETLAARTGVARGDCFPLPLQPEALIERVAREFAMLLRYCAKNRPGTPPDGATNGTSRQARPP